MSTDRGAHPCLAWQRLEHLIVRRPARTADAQCAEVLDALLRRNAFPQLGYLRKSRSRITGAMQCQTDVPADAWTMRLLAVVCPIGVRAAPSCTGTVHASDNVFIMPAAVYSLCQRQLIYYASGSFFVMPAAVQPMQACVSSHGAALNTLHCAPHRVWVILRRRTRRAAVIAAQSRH
jgi:hypothetical protein